VEPKAVLVRSQYKMVTEKPALLEARD